MHLAGKLSRCPGANGAQPTNRNVKRLPLEYGNAGEDTEWQRQSLVTVCSEGGWATPHPPVGYTLGRINAGCGTEAPKGPPL